ncbi:MAG: DUF2341 domain-containing protein [Verrucomicrobia bacterium]|nr:DUF2341 domain-containing protein [Verrucomicrobiota bacterium]
MKTLKTIKPIRDYLKLLAIGPVILACCLASQAQAQWTYSAWTNDADSGITSAAPYTVAVNCAGAATTVNGVAFQASALIGTNFSIGGAVNEYTGAAPNITGNSLALASSFIYNAFPRTVTLTHLTPGAMYETSLFSFGWDASGRSQTFASGSDSIVLDQDLYGNQNGIRIAYTFVADSSGSKVLTITPSSGNTFHLCALANRQTTPQAKILSFGPGATIGPVAANAAAISWTVPYGTNVTTLSPTFTMSPGATCTKASGSTQNFTSPVHYIVKASDFATSGTTTDYTVTVTIAPASSACDILTFGLPGNPGFIDQVAKTITWTVPGSPGVGSLSPTYTLSPFATCFPISGTTLNFTSQQSYTVTAQNGTTKKTYTVKALTYQAWTYSGSLFILTTPDGANIPAGASETNFPLLVRLNKDSLDFSQVKAGGADLRFATTTGLPLAYEIEQWDAAAKTAAIWVRIAAISGNARQEIKMYWGKADAVSESKGPAVFNAANGYCSVMHLNGNVLDASGLTSPVNNGATPSTAVIGSSAWRLQGTDISATNITHFPTGNKPTTTGEVWIRARQINSGWTMPLAWGNQNDYGWNTWTNQIGFWGSPTVLPAPLTCRGAATVTGSTALAAQQWYHVVYTSSNGTGNIYVNGVLDATASSGGSSGNTNPQAMTLVGDDVDVDEARISSVARSAAWVKMAYENQKPLQTLLGNVVQAGTAFSATPSPVTMNEGTTITLTGQAGGAQKVYWSRVQNSVETLLATDQFTYALSAGRVTGNQSFVIRFKAIYPSPAPNQTVDIPVTITDTIPDPVFTLNASTNLWDGRQTMTVTPVISNLAALQAAGVANLNYRWSVAGVAAARTTTAGTPTVPGVMTLTRAQGSGPMTVTLVLDNGGTLVSSSKTITVQEPASDAWAQRTPGATEKPVAKQFYARDPNTNNGTIFYKGTQTGSATEVYLKIYTTDTGADVLYATHRQNLVGRAYSFAVPIAAGKITYKVTYGTRTGGVDSSPPATVTDLVCGDAYLIEGQSNALATDNDAPVDTNPSPWIRSYGSTLGWGYATNKDSELQLGVWGWIWAKHLSTTYNMPICIINGAVGGTRIDQHQPNPAGHALPGSLYSIYATLFNRIVGAKLTHGIRAVLWHQGEQDQGVEGPDGDYDYKFYQQYFVDMSAAWKQDFPNIRKYYIFQIWPAACGSMSNGSDDKLREKQRTLPYLYSNMRAMSTLGIVPGAGCHYVLEGYQKFSDLISPLVEQDFYGYSSGTVFSAPNLKKAYYSTTARNEITLEFDQNIAPWINATKGLYYLDDVAGKVASGSVTGKVVKLTLTAASTAKTITYLKGTGWDGIQANLLYGSNGIAALTFADVPLTPPAPSGLGATAGVSQVSLTWTAAAGATGYNVKRSSTSGGPYAVIGTTAGTASYTDSTAANGTTYYYVVSANNTAGESSDSNQASATPNTPYGAWAANPAQGLTAGTAGPLDDPDRDGIPNVLEFVLGGAPMAPSQTILPKLTHTGGTWFYEYDRSDLSQPPATTQEVEYGNNLTGWTAITIPLTGAGPVVTITPGSPSDHVKVTLPALGANGFVRLKVTQ